MDSETMITIYICCHLIGMASTVFNPVMYGYRNEHLRHDALQVGTAKGSPSLLVRRKIEFFFARFAMW